MTASQNTLNRNKDTNCPAPNEIKFTMPGIQSKTSRHEKPGKKDPLMRRKEPNKQNGPRRDTQCTGIGRKKYNYSPHFQNLETLRSLLKPQIKQVKYTVCAMKIVWEELT